MFAWDAEDDLNKLMGDKSPVNHPNIPAEFPGVILKSNQVGPTVAMETPAINENAAAVGTSANVGIQHRVDDLAEDPPPPPSYRGLR